MGGRVGCAWRTNVICFSNPKNSIPFAYSFFFRSPEIDTESESEEAIKTRDQQLVKWKEEHMEPIADTEEISEVEQGPDEVDHEPLRSESIPLDAKKVSPQLALRKLERARRRWQQGQAKLRRSAQTKTK